MNILVTVVIVALLATIGSLAAGVISMGAGGAFDDKHSTQLMFARVGFQGVALVALVIALLFASGGSGA